MSTPPKVRYVPLPAAPVPSYHGFSLTPSGPNIWMFGLTCLMSFHSLAVPWPVIAPTKTTSAPDDLIFWPSAWKSVAFGS